MLKGLIVSCQAVEGEALHGYNIMGAMASAAVIGGADGIRTSSVNDIKEIKKVVTVPIIGIIKRCYDDSEIYITPTTIEVEELISAGCDVIALDATMRKRPNNQTLDMLVKFLREKAPSIEIMADIATIEEAKNAERLGFDYISTTLRGYTEETKGANIPDYSMIEELLKTVKTPVIVEGGIWERDQLSKVLDLKVKAVVIGTSITRPSNITARFKQVFINKKV